MIESTGISAIMMFPATNLVQEIKEVRGVVEPLNEYHEYHLNTPILIIPNGKTPRKMRREQERKNKVRRKWKPLC